MGEYTLRYNRRTRLAMYLLLGKVADAASSTSSNSVTEVTSITTFSGSTITEIYTPGSISISGLATPITAGTTITTTDSAGETIAIAVAAGAGVVAGGAIAAWIFKPQPGAPPAPTSAPSYSTEPQSTQPTTTTSSQTTRSSTSSTAPACPFPSSGYAISFQPVQNQPQWTAALPVPSTVSSYSPQCTQSGNNHQPLRGTHPGYINALAEVFCKGDLTKNANVTLGQTDLASNSSWNNAQLQGVRVIFSFNYSLTNPGCSQNCVDAYNEITSSCQYDSHTLYGGGSLKQGCGSYGIMIDADPITKLTCNPVPSPIYQDYEYRDAAVDSIDNFCAAQDGTVLTQTDPSTNVKETAFSISYASNCTGSGTYAVFKDTCVNYLTQALDSCDTTTTMFKHGGTVTDVDNCGAFTFHPFGYDDVACYPQNQNAGYISGTHVQITPAMAQDAIKQFCDREGKGQTYTLDPKNIPTGFSQDTCTQAGMAACGYYYNSDGSRALSGAGNIFIRMSAQYFNPGNAYECSVNQEYPVQGDRCYQELAKVIGVSPKGQCVGSDPTKLDSGSFVEVADKGCVLWDMWAVKTE